VAQLRRRLRIVVYRLADQPATMVQVEGGFALPRAIINQFFGPSLVRAEVIVSNGAGTQDWRIDRGMITAVSGTTVTLLERDNTSVTLQLDPNARVQGPARVASVAQLRRRLRIVVYRLADQPATMVQVEGVGR
jgi:hypothetical protein